MIRLGRRFNEAGEELTAGLNREGGRLLLENLEEAGLTGRRVEEGSELAAFEGIGSSSSSSSLGETSRSAASRLPKFREFSRFTRLSLITGTFSRSTDGLDLDSTSLESLLAAPAALWSLLWSLAPFNSRESLVTGLDLMLLSLESLRSLRAGLALGLEEGLGLGLDLGLDEGLGLGLEGLDLAGLVSWGLPGLSRATLVSSSSCKMNLNL